MGQISRVSCPVCRKTFELESYLEVGDITERTDCDAELRVVKLSPSRVEEVAEFSGDYVDDYEGKEEDEDKF